MRRRPIFGEVICAPYCLSSYSAQLTVPKAWTDIPTDLIRAELNRRQDGPQKPACGSGHVEGAYNTSLHVGALVLILVLSTAGRWWTSLKRRSIVDSHHSMLFPHHSTPFPKNPSAPPHSLPVSSLRHRRLDRNGVCPPPTYRLRLPHRSMPPFLLEPGISRNGGPHSHDFRPYRCWDRDVLCNKGCRAYARQRIRHSTSTAGAYGPQAFT